MKLHSAAVSGLVLIFAALFSLSFVTGCLGQQGKPSGFTAQDADEAIDAFNSVFFDTSKNLYSTKSNKKGVAAIWTQAIYWDMLMNAYKRTNDRKYYAMIEDLYRGGYDYYDKYNWNNPVVWFIYDDIMWWVISFARAYEITGDGKYLEHSVSGFNRVWYGAPGVDNGSYDSENGGLYWGWKHDQRGKTACINYPTVIAAMTLYNITKEQSYLDRAKEIYEWSRNTLFDKNNGRVADHKVGNNRANWTLHVYNQATCIGAAVMLYRETKEQAYLDDAVLAADYTWNNMSESSGILPFENGIEQGIYTAIFSQYIIRLIEDGNQGKYIDWMRYNANKGWANRDSRNLTFKNFNTACPAGVLEVYDASACPAIMQVIPSGDITAYRNPVLAKSTPDPTVIRAQDGSFYLYCTEDIRNMPIYRSADLVHWNFVGTAFTGETRPDFEPKGGLWAPDVNYINGKYVLYYSMSVWGCNGTCGIGVAVADEPQGPFTDKGALFQSNAIGVQNSIDQFYFEDGGKKYLFWGSFCGIYGVELEDDGLSLKAGAEKFRIAGRLTDTFDPNGTEGTYIHKRGKYYYCFGSTGTCCEGANSTYRVVVGRSESLFGPYLDKAGNSMFDNHYETVLHGNAVFAGPGHNAEIVTDDEGNDWMLYH
ncbi:MAG: family 43 glycosylhydrolase, partial [Bacteroidales bacterium]|nr:family 43 glycosylhydrolase [Bacteroidales bacterium]